MVPERIWDLENLFGLLVDGSNRMGVPAYKLSESGKEIAFRSPRMETIAQFSAGVIDLVVPSTNISVTPTLLKIKSGATRLVDVQGYVLADGQPTGLSIAFLLHLNEKTITLKIGYRGQHKYYAYTVGGYDNKQDMFKKILYDFGTDFSRYFNPVLSKMK